MDPYRDGTVSNFAFLGLSKHNETSKIGASMMFKEFLIDIGILSEDKESGTVGFVDMDAEQRRIIFGGDADQP
jgi:hypothetical protein